MIPREMIRCAPEHIHYLACNLVEDDVRQFLAFTKADSYSPSAIVSFVNTRANKDFRFTIFDPKTRLPAACFGGYVTRPGVMQSWMLSSPQGWRVCWRSITKGSRWLMDQVLERSIQRVETYVLEDRDITRRWYEKGLRMKLDTIDNGIALYYRGLRVCA